MLRTARIAPQEFVYHILTRDNNRQNIFRDDEDHHKYLSILQQYKEKDKFKLYHYVLMMNHVHLVIEPTHTGGAQKAIKKVIDKNWNLDKVNCLKA